MSKYTQEQLELKAHIEASNEKFIAEAKARGAVMWGVPSADLDMWAEYGVYNIAQYEREMLIGNIVDLHKDVHGFKDRYTNWDAMSMQDLEYYYNSLLRIAGLDQEYEEKLEQERKDKIRTRNAEFRSAGNIMAQAFANAK